MLHEFLNTHRKAIIERCRATVAQRPTPKATPLEIEHGIPMFLDQLITTLKAEQSAAPRQNQALAGEAGGEQASEIGTTAALHGRDLSRQGFTVDQVVHDYGDLCQAVTGLAFESGTAIRVDEFRTLNRCLDNAIADAVKAFSQQREVASSAKGAQALNEQLGLLAHELRNHLNTATLAITAIKAGNVGLSGATGAVLDRSLIGLRELIDRTLADVRATAGLAPGQGVTSLADLIAEVQISASLEASARGCRFTVAPVEKGLAVAGDRGMLLSAIGNLLQNAFKFTEPLSEVSLHAYSAGDRILIDIEDHCGGLPPGAPETMFLPFVQGGADRSGVGLGLSIARRGVEANHGVILVHDVPGSGCVFTIDLPRRLLSL